MKEEEVSVEELSYELSMVLEAMFYYDDALENSDASGSDEVIEIVEYMKKHHPKLFK